MNAPEHHEVPRSSRWATLASFVSVSSAALASACCLGPLLLAVLGLGGAGAIIALEPFRPFFIAVAVLFLGAGFAVAYRTPAGAHGSGGECACPVPRPQIWARRILWFATGLTVAFLAAPYVISVVWS
jgi:mercuric ion transport protein